MARPKGLPKIDIPNADFKSHRRATSQHGGALSAVPYGVQMVQRFTDGERDAASARVTTSTTSRAKRTSDANNLQPQKSLGENIEP
jgi:hypothetical protein